MSPETTRFAPSPSGYLHLGHAYAALFAAGAAGDPAEGGRFLLRIEDIDIARARPEYEDAICEDLAWLGLSWETPLRRQSAQLADYSAALAQLERRGLTYPCFCTRKEIAAEIERAGAAPHGRSARTYPGTCRHLSEAERQARIGKGEAFAVRLDMTAALAAAKASALAAAKADADGAELTWLDLGRGPQVCDPQPEGDIVLARKDVPASYHLSVVVDDAAQGVTLVTRGADLFEASHVHRLLQELLDLPVPRYHHHRLVTDASGERLAKRADALSLRALRAAGHSPEEVIAMTGLEQLEERTTP